MSFSGLKRGFFGSETPKQSVNTPKSTTSDDEIPDLIAEEEEDDDLPALTDDDEDEQYEDSDEDMPEISPKVQSSNTTTPAAKAVEDDDDDDMPPLQAPSDEEEGDDGMPELLTDDEDEDDNEEQKNLQDVDDNLYGNMQKNDEDEDDIPDLTSSEEEDEESEVSDEDIDYEDNKGIDLHKMFAKAAFPVKRSVPVKAPAKPPAPKPQHQPLQPLPPRPKKKKQPQPPPTINPKKIAKIGRASEPKPEPKPEPKVIGACSYTDCSVSEKKILDNEEFCKVDCSEKCRLMFHRACWSNYARDNKSKEIVNYIPCPTPDCWGSVCHIIFHEEGKVRETSNFYIKKFEKPKPEQKEPEQKKPAVKQEKQKKKKTEKAKPATVEKTTVEPEPKPSESKRKSTGKTKAPVSAASSSSTATTVTTTVSEPVRPPAEEIKIIQYSDNASRILENLRKKKEKQQQEQARTAEEEKEIQEQTVRFRSRLSNPLSVVHDKNKQIGIVTLSKETYGFILVKMPEGDKTVFYHWGEVVDEIQLQVGDWVQFRVGESETKKGELQAYNIELLERFEDDEALKEEVKEDISAASNIVKSELKVVQHSTTKSKENPKTEDFNKKPVKKEEADVRHTTEKPEQYRKPEPQEPQSFTDVGKVVNVSQYNYGFIASEGKTQNIFFHQSEVRGRMPKIGDWVKFNIVINKSTSKENAVGVTVITEQEKESMMKQNTPKSVQKAQQELPNAEQPVKVPESPKAEPVKKESPKPEQLKAEIVQQPSVSSSQTSKPVESKPAEVKPEPKANVQEDKSKRAELSYAEMLSQQEQQKRFDMANAVKAKPFTRKVEPVSIPAPSPVANQKANVDHLRGAPIFVPFVPGHIGPIPMHTMPYPVEYVEYDNHDYHEQIVEEPISKPGPSSAASSPKLPTQPAVSTPVTSTNTPATGNRKHTVLRMIQEARDRMFEDEELKEAITKDPFEKVKSVDSLLLKGAATLTPMMQMFHYLFPKAEDLKAFEEFMASRK